MMMTHETSLDIIHHFSSFLLPVLLLNKRIKLEKDEATDYFKKQIAWMDTIEWIVFRETIFYLVFIVHRSLRTPVGDCLR